MSLQIWLPLREDIKNYGLDNSLTVMSGTPSWLTYGKISNTGLSMSSRLTGTSNAMNGAIKWSVCFWFNTASSTTLTDNWVDLCGMTDISTGGTSGQFRFEACYGSSLRACSWHDNATNATINGSVTIATDNEKNTWHHVCVTTDGTNVKTYKDGVLIHTYTTGAGGHLNGYFWLGETNKIVGCIQDFRLYDHALSAKEVEEVSKGLVLHYKLDDIQTSIWSLNYYKRTAILTTSNTYIYSLPSKTIYLVPGKQYTVGAQIRVNQDNIKFYFDTNCTDENGVYSGNDAAQTVQYNPTITLEKDTWTQVWVTTTIKSDAGKPYYHHSFLFRTTSGELTTLCEIQNIEVYEGSAQIFTTYDKTNTVYDSSGYNNNGTINNITALNDSSRYNNGVKFNGSNSYIKVNENKIFAQHAQAMTINLWVKNTTWSNGANMKFFSCTESGGFNCEAGNSGYVRFPIYVCTDAAQTSYAYKYDSKEIQASALIANEWNMITWVYDTNGTKTYINGQLHHTYLNTSYGIHFNTNARLFLGCEAATANPSAPYYNGQMSDFRMYYTALSPEAILELYNTSATIDNNGNIYSRGFIENDSLNITKTGLFQTSTIEDDNNGQASIFKTKKILGTNLYEY